MRIKHVGGALLLCFLGAAPGISAAADSHVMPVRLLATSGDGNMVGPQLVYALREDIRKSSGYRLVHAAGPELVVHMNTLDIGNSGKMTTYAVTFTVYDGHTHQEYLNNYVGYCGSARLSQCAESILANLDSTVQQLLSADN